MQVADLINSVTRFEGLRLLGKLAEGPYGDLYLVEQEETGRKYGLKFLSPMMTKSMPLSGLLDSVKDAKGIEHPNVAQTYDIGLTGGQAYVLREFVIGKPLLAAASQRQTISMKELLNVATQSVRALAAVHEKGIVHNNLKPSNIIIGEGNQIKIVDFGMFDFKRRFGYERVHIPDEELLVYSAPEQLKGKEIGNELTDIYSVGTVIKIAGLTEPESVIGRSSVTAIADKIRSENYLTPDLRVNESVGKDFGNLLDRMTARRAKHRPSAGKVLAELEEMTAALESGLKTEDQLWISVGQKKLFDELAIIPRQVNVWLVDNQPPLTVGIAHKVGIDIGRPRSASVGGGEFKEPDWNNRDQLDLVMLLDGSNATISPGWQPVILPKKGNTEPVYYQVTPRAHGPIQLNLSIYLARELALLEEFLIELSAIEKVSEAAA